MAENTVHIRVTASGAAEAQKVLAAIATAGGQIWSVGGPAIKQAEQALNGLGVSAKRALEIFTGFTAATLFAGAIASIKSLVAETAKLGLEAKVQEDAFARLSKSVGVAGDVLVAQMNKAAGGILNTSDVMIAAAKALNQSLQPEQIVKLMEIARQQSKLAGIDVADAFNQITQAIANQQPRALKQLGIVVDMDDAFKKHAVTLGVEVAQLTELGKTQAIYNAVAEQTANSVKALTAEALTQSEQIQKLSGAWKQAKEDIGKVVVDVGFELLAWLQSIGASIPSMSEALTQFGVIWKGVWGGAVAAVEPVARILIDVFLPTLKLAGVAATAFGVGMNAGFSVIAGPLAYVASLIDDLARNKWPSHTRATLEANVATAEARVRLAESVTAMGRLAAGTTATSGAQTTLAESTGVGTNRLAGMAGQVKALIPDLKALAAEAEKVAAAIQKGHVDAAEAVLAETERGLALELELTNKRLADEAKLLEQSNAGWIAHAEAIEQSDLAGLAAELEITNQRLAEEKAALDATNAGWVAHAEGVLAGTTQELEAIVKLNAPLRAYQDTLEEIALKGQLLGSSFDMLAPSIAAVEGEIVRLGKAGQDVTALQEKLAGLKQVQGLKGIFQDVFSSIGSAINTSIQGVILGTQTMAQAWDNLWKSIVLSFINSGIQRLLKGLSEWAWDFLGSLFGGGGFSGGGGGGILGTLITGAGALLAKLGSGTSGIGPGTGTDPTGAFDAVTRAADGTATALNGANKGITNFSAGVGAALSAVGVGLGIYGLLQGGSAGSMALSAAGTAVALYGLTQSVSVLAFNAGLISTALPTLGVLIAQGLAAVAPTLAASIGTALAGILGPAVTAALTGTGTGVAVAAAGASLGAGLGTGLATAGSVMAGLYVTGIFQLVMGGLMGMARDAEMSAMAIKDWSTAVNRELGVMAQVGTVLDAMGTSMNAANLPATLTLIYDALKNMVDLNLIVPLLSLTEGSVGSARGDEIFKATETMRAQAGMAWMLALDEAFRQGVDTTGVLQSPWRVGRNGEPVSINMQEPLSNPLGTDNDLAIIAHLLDLTGDEVRELTNHMRAQQATWAQVIEMAAKPDTGGQDEGPMWDLVRKAFGPDRLPILAERLGFLPSTGTVDPAKVNAVLDKTWFTGVMHDAIRDIGLTMGLTHEQLTGAGVDATPGSAWQTLSTSLIFGGGATGAMLPTIAEIDAFAARLTELGFTAGHYGQALKDFLLSIDANIVNSPGWAAFEAALASGAGTVEEITDAIDAATIASMTPEKFYGAAKAATDSLTAAIKQLMDERAGTTDTDALKAIDDSIALMNDAITAYTGLVALYSSLPGEMAMITGDLVAQTQASVAAWRVSVTSLADTVAAAQEAFTEALAGGNIIAIQQTAQQLHDATMNGYAMMQQAVDRINAVIQGLLDHAGVLVQRVTAIAQLDIRANGSFATITSLLGSLQDIATHGQTAAIRLWAIAQGIQAIVAALPTAIEAFGTLDAATWMGTGMQTAAQLTGPAQITQAVAGAAAPFLGAQQAEIDAAEGAARLALLEQQAQAIDALATAAIAGVQQWATAAIAGAQAAAQTALDGLAQVRDAQLAAIDLEIAAITTQRTAALDAIDAQIEKVGTRKQAALDAIDAEIAGIQAAAQAEADYRATQMAGLQEAIQAADQFAAAAEQMAAFIQGLKIGPTGPGNPMDKLRQSQDAFATALAAYTARPSAEGLTGLQGLAQSMLSLAEPIFSKPSPQFQALSVTTIKQLTAAQAMAAGMATDAEVLRAQLAALQMLDTTAAQGVRDQLAALNDQKTTVAAKFDDQIKVLTESKQVISDGFDAQIEALTAQKQSITDDFETQTQAIQDALKTQIDAINKAAADEIDHIQRGTAAALQANMAQQIPLLQAQYDAANAQLAAIGDTKVWQDRVREILQGIHDKLALAIPAESGMARVTEGLYHLHDGEMVLPRTMADQVRSAAMGAGLPSDVENTAAAIVQQWDTLTADQQAAAVSWYGGLTTGDQQAAGQAAYQAQVAADPTRLAGGAAVAGTSLTTSKTLTWAEQNALYDPKGLGYRLSLGEIAPPAVFGPGGTPPPTTPTSPPVVPPYVPPGPGWLTGGGTPNAMMGGGSTPNVMGGGSGPLTIVVKLDGKTIGEATLPTVLADARTGKLRTVIVEATRK